MDFIVEVCHDLDIKKSNYSYDEVGKYKVNWDFMEALIWTLALLFLDGLKASY